MSALKQYFMFHGRRTANYFRGFFHVPKTLIELGQAHSVVYITDKKHGGGDGKPYEFEHIFETPVFLYMDERAKGQLYLIGKQLKVTEKGIEN